MATKRTHTKDGRKYIAGNQTPTKKSRKNPNEFNNTFTAEERIQRNIEKKLAETTLTEIIVQEKENIPAMLEKKKQEVIAKLNEYGIRIERTKLRDSIKEYEISMREDGQLLTDTKLFECLFKNPYPNRGQVRKYNAMELELLFDCYRDIISMAEENERKVIPTPHNLCYFLDISPSALKALIYGNDESIREVCGKMYAWLLAYAEQKNYKREMNDITYIFQAKGYYGIRDNDPPIIINNNTAINIEDRNYFRQYENGEGAQKILDGIK